MSMKRCHRRVTHRPPNAATPRGWALAMEALYHAPAMTSEEALAERERIRAQDQATRERQGELPLGKGS